MNEGNPKVFISHASEDKERFIERFATILLENGVDAWVSFWEINDGDSLVKKIFEDGIEKSSQFIIVLSKYSIHKPWVEKELDIAIVKQIEENYKIIPILLDDVKIPIGLKDTAYRRIKNLNDFKNEAKEIINSIFGLYRKPPLGKIPNYVKTTLQFPNLSKIDNVILNICFDILPEREQNPYMLDLAKLINLAKDQGIEGNDVFDSLMFLENEFYLHGNHAYDGGKKILIYPQFTTWGFEQVAAVRMENFNKIIDEYALRIFNEFTNDEYVELNSVNLAEQYKLPLSYSRYIVKILEEKNLCEISETIGCIWIVNITPSLKRLIVNKN